MRRRFVVLLAISGCSSATDPAPSVNHDGWDTMQQAGISVEFEPADSSWASTLLADAQLGRTQANAFFNADTLHNFVVRVYPSRSVMEPEWRLVFNAPNMQFQCWMIANANAERVLTLSPRVWGSQACGHSSVDAQYVRRIMTHEIVHVLHRRLNTDPALRNLAGSSWLVEGLAVLASGQFDASMAAFARQGLQAAPPTLLSGLLDTNYGYAFAGSIVDYIDRRYGRGIVVSLLRAADSNAIFAILQTTPAALLSDWRANVE
jgi:hypothetical protein